MTQPPGGGRGPLRAGRRRPAGDAADWWSGGGAARQIESAAGAPRADRATRAARATRSQAPDTNTNLPRRYTGDVDPGVRAMRKVWWKCLAVLPLLGLALWWIRSDAQDAREASAAPLAVGGAVGAGAADRASSAGRAVGAGRAGDAGGAGTAAGAVGAPAASGTALAMLSGPGGQGAFGAGSGPGIDPNLSPDSPQVGDPSWRRAPLWDDGKADFCAYEVSWAHYGHVYKGRALLVLVKEPWNPALDVKADHPGRDSFEVLKLNHVRDVPTGIYTYHQMASVFWRRDTGALQKVAATSSEACGISFAEMTRGSLQTHTYFDGQGDRTRRWPQLAWPEDGLPASLRTFVTGLLPGYVEVFPSLLAGRYDDLAPRTYSLSRRPAGDAGSAGNSGSAAPAVELLLKCGAAKLTYTFETAPPHRLRRFEREDGTTYQLAKCDRLAYWNMHDPGGEAWLPPAVR